MRGANYPKTEEGWEELGKRVATAHANYVIEKIERLNCPTWQKLELYQTVIDTTKGTYKPVSYTHLGIALRRCLCRCAGLYPLR